MWKIIITNGKLPNVVFFFVFTADQRQYFIEKY